MCLGFHYLFSCFLLSVCMATFFVWSVIFISIAVMTYGWLISWRTGVTGFRTDSIFCSRGHLKGKSFNHVGCVLYRHESTCRKFDFCNACIHNVAEKVVGPNYVQFVIVSMLLLCFRWLPGITHTEMVWRRAVLGLIIHMLVYLFR